MKPLFVVATDIAKAGVLAGLVLLAGSCATVPQGKLIDPQDLTRGTYIISTPGHYRLGGDAGRIAGEDVHQPGRERPHPARPPGGEPGAGVPAQIGRAHV